MRLRRRPGRPVPPHMDEVYADLHRLTELVLLLVKDALANRCVLDVKDESFTRMVELRAHLRERLAAQEKELEVGPPP